MDLASVLLGLAGIALGVNSLTKGAQRLAEGVSQPRPGAGVPPGVRLDPNSRVPTMIVPRSATRKMPPVVRPGVKVPTRAGSMSLELRGVSNLNDRLAVLIQKANQGKIDPKVVAWARREVTKKCRPGWNGEQWCIPEKRQDLEALAIFKAVRRDHRYLSDIVGVDTFSNPAKTLDLHGEDCDGLAVLFVAGVKALGIPARFKVIETMDSRDGANHIFAQAFVDGKWTPFDASVAMGPNWEAPPSMVRRAWVFETE